MEGITETPKADSSPNVPIAENKEMQLKAAELATATRGKGMGVLMGKFAPRFFPKNSSLVGGYSYIGKFIQDEQIPDNSPAPSLISWSEVPGPRGTTDTSGINHPYRQRWMKKQYVPPIQVIRKRQIKETPREVKFLGGLITKTHIDRKPVTVKIPTDTPITYHGKKGEKDWIRYDYRMIIEYPYDARSGTMVNMSVAVPPDIAIQIDEQVTRNVYFPDAFFKALYPGYIGPDAKQDVKRREATELEVIDLVGKPPTRELRKYTQPIPY